MSLIERSFNREKSTQIPSYTEYLFNRVDSLTDDASYVEFATELYNNFIFIKRGIAFNFDPSQKNSSWDGKGIKRTYRTGLHSWDEHLVSLPDDHVEQSAIRDSFTRALNEIVKPLEFQFENEKELHDYLYLLGFENGGLSRGELHFHIYKNKDGQRSDIEHIMINTIVSNLKRINQDFL